MNTTTDLLETLRAHLAAFEVPALFSIRLTPLTVGPNVSAQLDGYHLTQIAAGLLAWADTLTEVTTTAWRVSNGECVHLVVTGLLSGGVTVEVYGGVPFTGRGFGAELTPGSTTTVPLAVLRAMATLAEVTL
ncbi:MAG: hypothetical protein ACRDR6_20140 [Pseudonocardiaceae bacterium]